MAQVRAGPISARTRRGRNRVTVATTVGHRSERSPPNLATDPAVTPLVQTARTRRGRNRATVAVAERSPPAPNVATDPAVAALIQTAVQSALSSSGGVAEMVAAAVQQEVRQQGYAQPLTTSGSTTQPATTITDSAQGQMLNGRYMGTDLMVGRLPATSIIPSIIPLMHSSSTPAGWTDSVSTPTRGLQESNMGGEPNTQHPISQASTIRGSW